MSQLVSHFLSYVFAKYNFNWFTVGESYQKHKKGEVFIDTQCRLFQSAVV